MQLMSILRKKIRDGWFKDRQPVEAVIPLHIINWDELVAKKSTLVQDENGVPYKMYFTASGLSIKRTL
jgi:hypothetical protein